MSEAITHNFSEIIDQVLERAQDYRVPLKLFYTYLHGQTVQMFPRLGRKGNTTPFREVTWKWFADQYVRKDGTVIPAQGIPGQVKGRKRKSGKRITANSLIMSDSGIMRKAALASFKVTTHSLVMDTPVKYAKYQHKKRPYMFVTDDDVDELREMIIDYLIKGE